MAWNQRSLRRAYACNTKLLQYFRERRGWTQAELAKIAGYSERLISKAESGGSISTATIANLADALSSSFQKVYPEDLISDPVQLAKAFFASLHALGAGAYASVDHLVDENVVVKTAGDPVMIPFAGEYRGSLGFKNWLGLLSQYLNPPFNNDSEPWNSFVSNGIEVVVMGKAWNGPIGIRPSCSVAWCSHFKFRRGKVFILENFLDTFAMVQNLGYQQV